MEKKIIISEEDYIKSEYITQKWEQSVVITNWEHDFETKQYIIKYKEKNEKFKS